MIELICPKCSQKYSLPGDYAGKSVRCAKCKEPIRVPGPQKEFTQSRPPMIKFHCPSCNQKMGISAGSAGRQVKCTKCKQPMRVPAQQGPSAQEEPGSIKFSCPNCGRNIVAPDRYAGKRIKCANCDRPCRVPEQHQETVKHQPAADKKKTGDMFEDDIGTDDMFGDNIFSDNLAGDLLAAEAGAPAAEEELKLEPAAPEPPSSQPQGIDAVMQRAGLSDSTGSSRKIGKGGDNILLAIVAGVGLTLLGAAGWALVASIFGFGWTAFLATLVGPLAGVGLTLFTDKRSVGMGVLAVFIGFVGILSGKLFIAKWVVMPEIMPEIKQGMESGFEEIESQEISEEEVQDALKDPNTMFTLTLMQLAEDGEFENEFVNKVIIARMAGQPPPDMAEQVETAERRVDECLETWSPEKKEQVARAQLPRMIRQFVSLVFEGSLGAAIGFVAAFAASFSCLDIFWFPIALVGAYKIGAGRD